jgi:hypothetical protein
MRNYCKIVLGIALLLTACKEKKEDKKGAKKYISIPSIIEKQVAHIDTSLYSIVKITGADSLHLDTTYVNRADFRKEAAPFLEITDLSNPDNAARFNEESTYDTLIKRIIFTYTPVKPEKEEIQKQQLLVSQDIDSEGNNKVKTIIIEKVKKNRDGALSQHLLWRMDKSFLITTTTQKPGEPEVITVTRVTWNEENY